ncbi:MAG: serine/threonine-protein kinase [Candidatus Eremiobacteraeota bacterium]|nr:serine/threonine-protein kinase [Candidatus Eremiobacteraeota bacterium]
MAVFGAGDEIEEKYRVRRILGEGGMNTVYMVETLKGGRVFAMKVTKPRSELGAHYAEAYNSFLKEVSILMSTRHPCIPRIEDYFSLGDQYVIVEEFLEGTSLDKYLEHNLPSERQVCEWGILLCNALQALHKEKIIFRDLKPANIVLSPSEEVKLIDFDIARTYKDGQARDTTLLGTPGYAAPETYGTSQSDPRSDIYSLGATLHNLITGADPQDNPLRFEPIEKLRSGVNPRFEQIIMKALSARPSDRYSSVDEMKKELQKVLPKLIAPMAPPLQPSFPSPPAGLAGTVQSTGIGCTTIEAVLQIVITLIIGVWWLVSHMSSCKINTESTPPPSPAASARVVRYYAAQEPSPGAGYGMASGMPGILTIATGSSYRVPRSRFLTIYKNTFNASPSFDVKPSLKLAFQSLEPGGDQEAEFSCVINKPGSYHMKVCFVMPQDVTYLTSAGSFTELPGEYGESSITTLTRWSGHDGEFNFKVSSKGTPVEGLIKWRPAESVPELTYDHDYPWLGPRALLWLTDKHESLVFTKGFMIMKN